MPLAGLTWKKAWGRRCILAVCFYAQIPSRKLISFLGEPHAVLTFVSYPSYPQSRLFLRNLILLNFFGAFCCVLMLFEATSSSFKVFFKTLILCKTFSQVSFSLQMFFYSFFLASLRELVLLRLVWGKARMRATCNQTWKAFSRRRRVAWRSSGAVSFRQTVPNKSSKANALQKQVGRPKRYLSSGRYGFLPFFGCL